MQRDDIIYVIYLLICIGAGNYFKQISSDKNRKVLCTLFGLLMVFLVSGWSTLHCLISTALGAAAIIYIHPSNCHTATFVVMFAYLTFFRLLDVFNLYQPPGPTNMIQMILTLKVAGLAFEKTAAWKKLQQAKQQPDKKATGELAQLAEVNEYDVEIQSIGMVEIFHYTFNYIGVLTGPYYRYRTYRDYFNTPFKNYANNITATVERLKAAAVYCALYLVANHLYPLSYALSDAFYNQRSFFYRLMYVWPTFFIFRMRMYTGLTLSECVCTMAGFGAYPDESNVNNGEGPKQKYEHLKRTAEQNSYNFTTIVNTRVMDVEKCWTFRESMKHWNICVQYWLAVNVYKLFPSKKYRIGATFVCSAYWHGFRSGHYLCLLGAPIYIILEDVWHKLVRAEADGWRRQIIDIIFWICKFFALSYLNTAFLLSSFSDIWKFYGSVYHIGYIAWVVMFLLGMYLTQQKSKSVKGRKRDEINASEGQSANEHIDKLH